MKRTLLSSAIDLVAGVAAAVAVIVATDSTGIDLRVYLVTAVVLFFLVGLWRGGSEGFPLWSRALLIALVPILLSAESMARHWPLDPQGLAYGLLFPLLQLAAAGAGLRARRSALAPAHLAVVALGLTLATGLAAQLTMPPFARWLATDYVERPLPEVTFESFAGQRIHSRNWQGKVVVLDFWASWCIPCVAELAELETLYQRWEDRDDVVFWAIGSQDERQAAEQFVANTALTLPWAWDEGNQAFQALGVNTVPTLYLIDRRGQIRMTHVGYSATEDFLEHTGAMLESLVAETTG